MLAVETTRTTPAEEAWELACEVDGSTVATRSVHVDRGERLDLGNVCG